MCPGEVRITTKMMHTMKNTPRQSNPPNGLIHRRRFLQQVGLVATPLLLENPLTMIRSWQDKEPVLYPYYPDASELPQKPQQCSKCRQPSLKYFDSNRMFASYRCDCGGVWYCGLRGTGAYLPCDCGSRMRHFTTIMGWMRFRCHHCIKQTAIHHRDLHEANIRFEVRK